MGPAYPLVAARKTEAFQLRLLVRPDVPVRVAAAARRPPAGGPVLPARPRAIARSSVLAGPKGRQGGPVRGLTPPLALQPRHDGELRAARPPVPARACTAVPPSAVRGRFARQAATRRRANTTGARVVSGQPLEPAARVAVGPAPLALLAVAEEGGRGAAAVVRLAAVRTAAPPTGPRRSLVGARAVLARAPLAVKALWLVSVAGDGVASFPSDYAFSLRWQDDRQRQPSYDKWPTSRSSWG